MLPRSMQDRLPKVEDLHNGDQLRNANSFEYLAHLAVQIPFDMQSDPVFITIYELCGPNSVYNPNIAYGDLYTKFLLEIENFDFAKNRQRYEKEIELAQARIEVTKEIFFDLALQIQKADTAGDIESFNQLLSLYKILNDLNIKQNQKVIDENQLKLQQLDLLVDNLYANPNQALERSYAMVEKVLEVAHQTSAAIEDAVRNIMIGDNNQPKLIEQLNYLFRFQDKNKITPQEAGSKLGRLKDMLSKDYKPQTTTSLSSIRTYQHQTIAKRKSDDPFVEGAEIHVAKEYRFGTQGQFHKGTARISPIFTEWLNVQGRIAQKHNQLGESRISHIYFNNLGYDRSGYEGEREKLLTEQLHHLETDPQFAHLAVITLPADKGLMNISMLKNHEASITYQTAKTRMLDIASGNPDAVDRIRDFVISPRIKALLYKDDNGLYSKEKEIKILSDLLEKSFKTMGFNPSDKLSDANLQAVYFHFVKFELTNYIIETLKPVSFNMSCKDAIDRGGVSSAYYNLMVSLEKGAPMSKEEFHRALHAAPTLVKGRGMNHHTQLIWNAVDLFLHAQGSQNKAIPDWLREWRNNNAPQYSKQFFMQSVRKYIEERKADPRLKFFSKENKAEKISAAKKLYAMLEGKDVTLTKEEIKALTTDRLGKLYRNIEEQGFVTKLPKLEKEQREIQHIAIRVR